MKNVLLVQPSLQPPGGGNAVAAWILEALKDRHEMSVMTLKPVDVVAINRFYGTMLREAEFTAYCVPSFLQSLSAVLHPGPLHLRKINLLLRFCKRIQREYDVVIYAQGEADLGCRAIQYVHNPAEDCLPQPGRRYPWFRWWQLVRT